MRKAKVAAIIFGGVTSCLFSGLFAVYSTAPVVSSVAPKTSVEKIYEVKNEELANVAAVTSIKIPAATTSRNYISRPTTTQAVTTTAVSTTSDEVTTTVTDIVTTTEPVTEPATVAQTTEVVIVTTVDEQAIADSYENEPATDFDSENTQTTAYTETEHYTEENIEVPDDTFDVPDVPEQTVPANVAECTENNTPLSDSDFIILCNAVANEAGSCWIDVNEKAKVVEVIMNRVNSPLFPNSISAVLTQQYQFDDAWSYVNLGNFSSYVTNEVKTAVNLYFSNPASFSHGYISFYGDGIRNHFS